MAHAQLTPTDALIKPGFAHFSRCGRQFGSVANSEVIWCDPVNIFESLGWFLFLHLPFRGQGQPRPWQVMATIDQADIRGSEPHNHDPSGAASD
jgi:hypothetical protein